MATDIYFAGDEVPLRVDEDTSQIADAFASAQGLPIRLTRQDQEVFINPGLVAAFMAASEEAAEAEPAHESQRSLRHREAVTDIWGNPVRKKRRR
jgi:hypothetical protein